MGNTRRLLYDQLHSKRFYKYLLSYIFLLLFLLIIIGGVVYKEFVVVLQKEVESANITALMQMMNNMDMQLKEMERITVQILSNPKLTSSQLARGGYDTFEGVRELQKYKSDNTLITDIAIYYNNWNTDMIYSASGTYNLDNFFSYVYRYREWDKNSFKAALSNIKSPVMRPLESVKKDNLHEVNIATYLYPFPVGGGKPFGIAMFLVEEGAFNKLMRGLVQNYNGCAYILDQNGEIIASVQNGETIFDLQDMYALLNTNSIVNTVNTVSLNNRQFSVIKLLSSYNKWSYVMAMPTDQFRQKVYSSQRTFNIMVIILLAFGSLVAILFSIYHFKPWQKLTSMLGEMDADNNTASRRDEADYIYYAVSEMKKQNQGMLSQLKSQAGLIKEQFLTALLKGRFSNYREVTARMEMVSVKMDKPYFSVALFLLDDYENFEKNNDKSMQDLFKFSIINIAEELSQEMGYGYAVDLGDNQGIALLLNSADADFERHASELAYKTKDFFKQHYKLSLSVGIGSIYEDILKVPNSFKEACDATYYRLIMGENQVILYKDVKDVYKNKYWYPLKMEEQLVAAVKQGNSAEAQKIIKTIINEMKKQMLAPQIVHCICFGIINSIMLAMSQVGIIEYDFIVDENPGSSIIHYSDTLELVEREMVNICIKASEHIKKYKEDNSFDLINEIIEYAKQNYNNANISLSSIATEFGLTQSYITRIFRERTGYTLMHYIDNLRMCKVKELLKETNLYLKEILDKVGYGDETSFIKRFKKIEGMTPIQYRSYHSQPLKKEHGNEANF